MSTREPSSSSASDAAVALDPGNTDLRVRGTVPGALSGMFLHIAAERLSGGRAVDEKVVRALRLRAGCVSHRNRWIVTDRTTDLVSFGASILALADDSLAHELPPDRATARRVDLAGAGRSVVAHCIVDPGTGELHLLTHDAAPAQLHVTVSRGGLTRSVRAIHGAPNHVAQFAIARDHIVLLAEGFVGLSGRANVDLRPSWFAIDTVGRTISHVHAHGDSVSLYVDGPSLERWTLRGRGGDVQRQVLDAAPQTLVRSSRRALDLPHRFLWTVGAGAAYKHDVRAGDRERHDLGRSRHATEPVFVTDPHRSGAEDGGWLLGFVRDEVPDGTALVVLDAQFVERPAIATVPVPWPVPDDARAIWVPPSQTGGRSLDGA